MLRHKLPSEFVVNIDHMKCIKCKRCIQNCGWDVYSFADRIIPDNTKCVACQRCATYCPQQAISIFKNSLAFRDNMSWTPNFIKNVWRQALTGGVLLTGMGNDMAYPVFWDSLLIDACQVTNPSIDPLREPMELRTYLGRKPDILPFIKDNNGRFRVKEILSPQLRLEIPFVFAGMSYGSISLNAQKAMAIAAGELGIVMNTGEGGLHEDLYPYRKNIIVQCASGRFGVHADYLNSACAVEIKIGQGAKPGIGGHLPGVKVSYDVSKTRMIPVGTDAISPAPHHDIYSIEDLRQLIYALKEVTGYKPVSVKIAAVHHVASICCGVARAGADIIYIDGFRGGTGAAPYIIRNHVGIPIELALAAVDDKLRQEGIRNQISIIAAGGIRSSADAAKAIALGADAVAVGTAALVALGCSICQKCYTGNCSWGITTQRPELVRRLDPEVGADRLINLIRAWSNEIKEILGALGMNAIESLRGNRERLRAIGLDEITMDILGVKPAGR